MKRTSIKPKETKTCQDEDCKNQFKPFLSTQKYCSSQCAVKNRKDQKPKKKKIYYLKRTPIKPISNKQKKDLGIYHKKRLEFLARPENKKCPVTGNATTEIHHMKGRQGYADEWARDQNIKLLNDERFWLAVSRKGHQKIEMNPEWAKEQGFSIDRLS